MTGIIEKCRHAVFALLTAIILTASPAIAQKKQLLEYPSIHSPVVGAKGMVVSQNAIASDVGADILRRGGNAVDAAVAIGFALAVTLPRAGNIGGDGFMLVHDAKSGEQVFFDFRSVAPKAATLAMYVDNKGEESKVAGRGYLAPSVPGTVAGLDMAHKKFGKLPWADVVAPSITLARNGVALTPDEAFVFDWGKERLSTSTAAKAAYYKSDGSLYRAGEKLKQPDLAWTLTQIAKHGADGFYKGPVAERFAADMKANGGFITKDDLAAYRAVERKPLRGSYRGLEVVTAPPASAGGATLLNMLNILEGFDLKPNGVGSAQSLHIMAEAMKLGYADRYRILGDTDFVTTPVQGFISKSYAASRAKLIDPEKAKPVDQMGAGDPLKFESPSTTHFSVADAQGNVVSTTYTLGADFGSGVMIAGTGILLNNQMNNFSHEQTAKALREGAPPPPNAMAPGKRMLSTMMPTIVLKNGKPWLVTGTPGGSTIIDTVLQVIVNVVDFNLNVEEATHQPRIFQDSSDKLRVEPNFNPDTVRILQAKGHTITSDETMGSAQSIMIENGLFLGAADPRRPGALAIPPERKQPR
ncbi:MAG: gamma-glutamyltransferase [Sphingomonadales bacterium]|jgi:gamma-glutamyltranspeptidase/glutathione hydrolase|uniref:gamma-glutamyltransferase n=3 Tax=Sphingorhabdus sp. TaxID=1902408 RepID=UPI003BAF1707|nr:gamma-glutamyltransferase [Sphingomonadales bacterium]MBK9431357.1 gamma-glutamyltransferase [Sphingomonadales bacterium]MBL0022741.1 gamma-glutamyltransferase [Sphingomonadales bacterium]